MTDTIAHPPLPEPAGHVFTNTMEAFAKVECHGHIYSLPQSDPVYGSTVPLYTAQQMREYRDAPAWLPIETAPKDGTNVLLLNRVGNMACGMWMESRGLGTGWFLCSGSGPALFFNYHHGPTHWMPLPAAPIEQATGEVKP